MSLKRLLVTGGSGYLGRQLINWATPHYDLHATYFSHPATTSSLNLHHLNITNQAEVEALINSLKPQAIIHTAASNPGNDPETMMKINCDGSWFVAKAAQKINARLVHVSSDALHDGKNSPYADDAPPTPLNRYGQSKAAAEEGVIKAHPGAVIVRTSLIYGLTEIDRGTAGFIKRLQRGETLELFQDQIRQPVLVDTLAEALLKLAFEKTRFAGWLNVAGSQALSRLQFARRMFAWWNIDAEGHILPVNAAKLSLPIPLNVRLTLSKAQNLLQMTFPGVDEVLARATKQAK